MNKKIYKIQIQMTSQNDCDAVKKICEDYGLPHYDTLFHFIIGAVFCFNQNTEDFYCIVSPIIKSRVLVDKEPITIPQFLEILNEK